VTKFDGPHSVPNKGKIPRVAHLYWIGKSRAWHGDVVYMQVITENVPDGAALELQIHQKGKKDIVDTVKGLKIQAGLAFQSYTIQWKDKLPPRHGQEFVFTAVIGKLVSDESPVLLVDVEPPVFSA
jgi:hypothetical protein